MLAINSEQSCAQVLCSLRHVCAGMPLGINAAASGALYKCMHGITLLCMTT